jgi:hypothetical protein
MSIFNFFAPKYLFVLRGFYPLSLLLILSGGLLLKLSSLLFILGRLLLEFLDNLGRLVVLLLRHGDEFTECNGLTHTLPGRAF